MIAYLVGNAVFANYLQIHYVPGTGELAVFCGALVGAGLGFLWFNAPPAMVFMGDTGSLSVGGALGAISVVTKHELVLAIIGGLFVLETVSVIVQVASFKLTGKRVFRMAPLHHHFEKKGWAEPTIVIRFWIIAADPGARRPLDAEVAVSADGAASTSAFPPWPARPSPCSASRRSGLSPARALKASGAERLGLGRQRRKRATRPRPRGIPLVDLAGADWSKPAALVLAPGIPHTFPEPHPVAALATARRCRRSSATSSCWRAPSSARAIVGITGTNGKSTTTALIGHILRSAGLRASRSAAISARRRSRWRRSGTDGIYVLEMSSYQLELTHTLAFDVAVLLNITPDHLDRHGGMDGYIAAKAPHLRAASARRRPPSSASTTSTAAPSAPRFAAGRRQTVIPISADGPVAGGVYAHDGWLQRRSRRQDRARAAISADATDPARQAQLAERRRRLRRRARARPGDAERSSRASRAIPASPIARS